MTQMASQECFLKDFINCGGGSGGFVGAKRLQTASLSRGDSLHEYLSNELDVKYWCHRSCVSSYTSKSHIKYHASKTSVCDAPPLKRSRRSGDEFFVFKEHCFLCGKKCEELDPRHPDRWRPVSYCRTADRGKSQKTFKDVVLDTCDQRNDEWGNQVRLRIQAAVSDLHAADAKYHRDCLQVFKCKMGDCQTAANGDCDEAFLKVLDCMISNKSRIWNSIEVEELYQSFGGVMLTRRNLIENLSNKLEPDLLILSGVGVANILVFRTHASKQLKIVGNSDDDDIDTAIERLSKVIIRESKELKRDQTTYDTRICLDDALASSSSTFLQFMSRISSKLDDNLPAAMAGNMVTCAVTNKPTLLQIALGVVIREKVNIELLHDLGITSSYDEVLRFKSSAAHAAAMSKKKQGISSDKAGFVQVVADNFDANISSPNGIKSTHALAILLTQPQNDDGTASQESPKIKRLKKTEMSENIKHEVPIHEYEGPKKPDMPRWAANKSPLPLCVLASQVISLNRAREEDCQFLKDIITVENAPEFGGYNTRRAREQGHSIKARTKAVYLPLIDMAPAEPTTILTAMVEAQKLTNATGQIYTVFTNDQQLYRIAVNITWVYSDLFLNFVPRLGGMHTLMSFIGAIGTLMADTGLEPIMNVAFGGVSKMLTGKKFPNNVRALRMVVEELLRGFIASGEVQTYTQLIKKLEDQALESRTTKLWVDNLIKPVLITMLFIRAEREGDWPLHLMATKMMMPYFFSAGHFNYARYCLYYLHSMSQLPGPVQDEFMKGNHVMRHQCGIWNGLWSDLFIESTFMRYGHSPGGIVGLTLQPSTLKRWALSLHLCAQLKKDIMSLSEPDQQTTVMTHKEEGASRKVTDAMDRAKIRDKLVTCIDPLTAENHATGGLVNIVTGRISPASVNVDESVDLGNHLMKSYEEGWPQSFNKPLTKPIVTMSGPKKRVIVGDVAVCDVSLIFSRLLCLQKVRDINMREVLGYELAGAPPSMFDEAGEMRITKSKSTLKSKLQVELTDRRSILPDAIVLDGCAVLWVIHWPSNGLVKDYIKNLVDYIASHLRTADTFLIFDRYFEKSIKDITRTSRAGKDASRQHQLTMLTPLPPQKVCLTVTKNKIQLIDLIWDYLKDQCILLPQNGKALVVTGAKPIPMEICNGNVQDRPDLSTTHEEADVIIVQQTVHLANMGKNCIRVLADDTDVFVLLLHFYKQQQLTCNLLMSGTSFGRKCANIKATVEKQNDIIDDLLPAHVLSGCDTVSALWGIGKGTVIRVLKSGNQSLKKLGDTTASDESVMAQSISFIASCYGLQHTSDMTSLRYLVWTSKMGNHKLNSAPKLRVLPPTNQAFEHHVRRAQLQAAIWRSAFHANPPELSPLQYGWTMNAETHKLEPISLSPDVSPAPESVLKMIKCGCSSSEPCSTARCSCLNARISCSDFCACHADTECRNPQTITSVREEEIDEFYEDEDVEEESH